MIGVSGQCSVNVGVRVRFTVGVPEHARNVDNDDQEAVDRNRSVAEALNEFGRLVDKAQLVYDLHMLSQQAETKLDLVRVSNIPPEDFSLDDRRWSRLNCQTLELKPYTTDELQAILEDQVEQAFQPRMVQ